MSILPFIPERTRVARLRSLRILGTPPDPEFDALTAFAVLATGMTSSVLSLVDESRVWFKSAVGAVPAGGEFPREMAFCARAMESGDLFEVEDARADPRFSTHPLVATPDGIVHYAGAPVVLEAGYRVGTLCVFDARPGLLNELQRSALTSLAEIVACQLAVREEADPWALRWDEAYARCRTGLRAVPHRVQRPTQAPVW